ncbi:MAG: transposase [Paraclostridium dentum]|uniref:transposase n=1 Tax=Paraclostridium dentum TaxID=2662455 RepID=UPI003EE5AE28
MITSSDIIKKVYSAFPTEDSYEQYLSKIKLEKDVNCVYCYSNKITIRKLKFHCNLCNSNFSITTNTVMHKTKLDYRLWLISIYIFMFIDYISYRELSRLIKVNKNTAYNILIKLSNLFSRNKQQIFNQINFKKTDIENLSRILTFNIL